MYDKRNIVTQVVESVVNKLFINEELKFDKPDVKVTFYNAQELLDQVYH